MNLIARCPLRLLAFFLLPILLSACATPKAKPGKFAIKIQVDTNLADVAMQVDFIADPTFERSRWEQLNVNEYWPNGTMRTDARPITLTFGPGQERTRTVPISDPRYAEWLKKKPLFAVVIRDYPSHLDSPGAGDPRRLVFSLDEQTWAKKPKELTLLIQESGIKVENPLNLKKK